MKSKPVKSTNPKIETIISLQQKNEKLQVQIKNLKVKLLKCETKNLKQEQKITRLQTENEKLKNGSMMALVADYFNKREHNESPEK